jgi:hypothetical protein
MTEKFNMKDDIFQKVSRYYCSIKLKSMLPSQKIKMAVYLVKNKNSFDPNENTI